MFNKIFKTLSKTFAGKEDSRQEAPAPTRAPAPVPAKAKSGSLLDKLSGTTSAS